MDEPRLKKTNLHRNELIMRHTQSFLYTKSIKEWFCFPVNFVKFLRIPFLQNTSGWLVLVRLKSKVKLWLQSKRIYTPLPWPLRHLLICETGNKWHMCKSIYMEVSGEWSELFRDAWMVPFFPRKKFLVNSLECFRKQERSL